MKIATWIENSLVDERSKFIEEVTNQHELKQVEHLFSDGEAYEVIVTECHNANVNLFLIHDGNIRNIKDGGKIKLYGLKGIPTIVFGGGIGNEYLVGDNLVIVHDDNFIEYLPSLISYYLKHEKIDLTIMLGGIYNYYRLLRDKILDAFYDRASFSFKDKPNTLNQELIDHFPCSKGYYDDMVAKGGQENFIKLRDSLNSEIKRKAFQSEGR